MPWDKKEFQKFLQELVDAGNLSENARKALLETVAPELSANEAALTYLEGNQLRQGRFSQKFDELSKKEQQYNQAIQQSEQLQKLYDDLKGRPDTSAQELQKVRNQLSAMQASAARVYQEINQYSDGEEILKQVGWSSIDSIYGGKAPTNPTNPTPSISTSQPTFDEEALLKKIEERMTGRFNPYFQQIAEFSVDSQDMLLKLASLGVKTTPSELKKTLGSKMAELKTDNYWEAFNAAYDIPTKEKEQEFSTRLAEAEKQWNDKHQAELNRRLLSRDGSQVADEGSEIFKLLGEGQEPKKDDPPQKEVPNMLVTSNDEYAQAASALKEVRGA